MLRYHHLKKLYPHTRGVEDDIHFKYVFTDCNILVNKGLYVPINSQGNDNRDLFTAIENGAVGSLWNEERELPKYIPNHFPVFIVHDSYIALKKLLVFYDNLLLLEDIGETNRSVFKGDIPIEENELNIKILKLMKGGDNLA
ncbi:hypothetical protein [Cytobacillus sp. IB215316]|uniref:hypothetical protein n=1 Tax=Cytobacillus sp. IB215316 TaxID=3097354 RepID=UPI002A0AB78F|nr:hypothetical protein [Cytobacillus sp. IB215316]MDX8359997.1 hypothetical protein [Cytobacillus sp. IB215316]